MGKNVWMSHPQLQHTQVGQENPDPGSDWGPVQVTAEAFHNAYKRLGWEDATSDQEQYLQEQAAAARDEVLAEEPPGVLEAVNETQPPGSGDVLAKQVDTEGSETPPEADKKPSGRSR